MATQFNAKRSTAIAGAHVIGAIMMGLEPIVFLVGGVYAATVYAGVVETLRT